MKVLLALTLPLLCVGEIPRSVIEPWRHARTLLPMTDDLRICLELGPPVPPAPAPPPPPYHRRPNATGTARITTTAAADGSTTARGFTTHRRDDIAEPTVPGIS